MSQSGALYATGLRLLGSGAYTLTNGLNAVTTLAANTTAAISYRDTNGLAIGSVTGTAVTDGITTSSTCSLQTGAALTQSQPISATTLTATTVGGATLTNASNNVTGFTATNTGGSAIELTDAAVALSLVAGGVTQSGTAGSITIICNTADATLTNAGAMASTGGTISLTADNMTLGGTINAGTNGTLALLPFATTPPDQPWWREYRKHPRSFRWRARHDHHHRRRQPQHRQFHCHLYRCIVVDGDASFAASIAGPAVLSTAGAITRPLTGTLSASGTLSLNAATGIGIVATAPIHVGSVGGLSATNSTSGNIYIYSTLGTAITLGGTGYSLTETPASGALRVDAAGNIVIAASITVSSGTISLNANGTITEQSAGAGTLIAPTVSLGTAGSTTAIGIPAAPILTQATTLLSASATTGIGVYMTNTGNLNLTATASSGVVNVTNTGTTTTAAAASWPGPP